MFAEYFGYRISELRGNRISGDDLYLLNAIDEDRQSITFNNVAYLYDTDSRLLKQNISILPLKLKADVEEALRKGNLDATLQVLENQQTDIIPVESFGFTYSQLNPKAEQFLEWVVNDGQKYNNQKGFLKLTNSEVKSQLALLAQK